VIKNNHGPTQKGFEQLGPGFKHKNQFKVSSPEACTYLSNGVSQEEVTVLLQCLGSLGFWHPQPVIKMTFLRTVLPNTGEFLQRLRLWGKTRSSQNLGNHTFFRDN